METEKKKECVLRDNKICDNCYECEMCDINPVKVCDNCCKCINFDDYAAIKIDKVEKK